MEARRRRQTRGVPAFLFTDVEGSTQLLRDLESEWAAIIERQRAIIVAASEVRGGRLVSTAGDGCFCAFEDDDGVAAIEAAVAAQAELLAQRWPGGADVRVRMGVHAGPAVRVGDEWVGLAIHQAARLSDVAHGGQIVVAADVCPATFQAVPLGRHVVKDFEGELELVQLTAPGWRTPFPPLRTLARWRHNLPLRRTTFVGREADQARVDKLVDETRLVTILGPGGVGKTRLAIETAGERMGRHRDGTFLVELAPVAGGGVAAAVSAAVAEPGATKRSPGPLVEQLAERHLLLVIDNCEHLIDEVAAVVDDLLDHCPHVHVIATSREALGLPGEALWRLDALPVPESGASDAEAALDHAATRLLLDRAQLVRPDLVFDDQAAAAIVRICRRLDGLPLAIELAAARLASLTVPELDEQLADRFDVLDGARRSGAVHQRTLDDLVGWSYDLLDVGERAVLRRLSVFAGHCGGDAAAAVCADDGDGSVLDHLVARSLVQADVVDGLPRYRLLETVRAHAHRRLVEAGEEDRTVAVHATWFAELVRREVPRLASAGQAEAMRTITAELDEIRRALRTLIDGGEGDLACGVAGRLRSYWLSAGLADEGRRWLAEALALAHGEPTANRARALQAAGWLAADQSDFAAAEPLLQECVVAATAVGEDRCHAQGLDGLARLAMARGDTASAESLLEESLAVRRRLNIAVEVSSALNNLAGVVAEHDPTRAATLLEEALHLDRESMAPTALSIGLRNLGLLRWPMADVTGARAAWTEALALARSAGDRRLEVLLTHDLARCAEADDDLAGAARLLDEALTIAGTTEAGRRQPSFSADRARVARRLGEFAVAVEQAERARSLALEVGESAVAAAALGELALVAIGDGDLERAGALVDEARGVGGEPSPRIALALALGDVGTAEALLREAAEPGQPPAGEGPTIPGDRREWAGWWRAVT